MGRAGDHAHRSAISRHRRTADCPGRLPGESATIGNPASSGCSSGVRSKGNGEHYWTIAGFNLRGADEALTTYGVNHWRLIGNDMTCPNGNGASACYETGISTFLQVYGNNVHDTGTSNASALYHGVYFSTDSNHIDFGWNTIADVHGCRGLQIHSSPLTGGGSSSILPAMTSSISGFTTM